MATISLPTNAPRRRVENGTVAAGVDLSEVTSSATDTVEICELPNGAVVLDVVVQASIDLGALEIGIAGDDITNDVDFFRASAVSGADNAIKGDLRLGYKAETDGEVVTFTSANAVTAATGRAYAIYSMDVDVNA